MSLPSPERLAHHEAGHAVVQHWVARGRFHVVQVSLMFAGGQVAGSSLIDLDVELGLYEFGLLTLAGIAAENRYFALHSSTEEEEGLGAVGDIREWQDSAGAILGSDARVELVTRNVMKRLAEFFADPVQWGMVETLAGMLLAEGTVEGERLQTLLNAGLPPA